MIPYFTHLVKNFVVQLCYAVAMVWCGVVAVQAADGVNIIYWDVVSELDAEHQSDDGLTVKEFRQLKRQMKKDYRKVSVNIRSCIDLVFAMERTRRPDRLRNDVQGIIVDKAEECLIKADLLRRFKCTKEALAVLNQLGGEKSGDMRVRSAEGLSDVLRDERRLESALEWIKYAMVGLKSLDRYNEEVGVRKRLQAKKKRIETLIEITTHGVGFHYYIQARRHQEQGKWEKARTLYDRLLGLAESNRNNSTESILAAFRNDIGGNEKMLETLPISPVYEAAAECYRARCLIELVNYSQSRKDLLGFMKSNPLGLYRGEAQLLLARIALDGQGSVKQAGKHYTEILNWVKKTRQLDADLAAMQVPSQTRQRAAPPLEMRHYDMWGNSRWADPKPEAVVNRLTAQWYINDLLYQAHIGRALCLFVQGQGKEALPDLEAALRYDPMDQKAVAMGGLSNFGRLRDGFSSGRLYATKEELRLFSQKQLFALVRAEILFECERWGEAIESYRALRRNYGNRLTLDAHAYLDYVEASALLYTNKSKEAEGLLHKGFVGEEAPYRYSPSCPRAMVALANVHQLDDPIPWLKKGLEITKDKNMYAQLLLTMGQYHYVRNTTEDNKSAQGVFEQLLKFVVKTDYRHRAAQQYLAGLEQRHNQGE